MMAFWRGPGPHQRIRAAAAGLVCAALSTLLGGCIRVPEHVEPVTGFELERYLGTWYEIARLDHSFERGLTHVTADYSRREDGGVRVLNRGYDPVKKRWKEAEGRAYFIGDEATASLSSARQSTNAACCSRNMLALQLAIRRCPRP